MRLWVHDPMWHLYNAAMSSDFPGPAWPESRANGLGFRASGLKIQGPRPRPMASESFGFSWPAKCGLRFFRLASHSFYIKPALSQLNTVTVVTRNTNNNSVAILP